jgi:predicted DNA-binding WGR domain protein
MAREVKMECVNADQNHKKFWSAYVSDNLVLVEWGRIGTNGSSKRYGFASEEEANKFFQSKAIEKFRHGYKIVGGSDDMAFLGALA